MELSTYVANLPPSVPPGSSLGSVSPVEFRTFKEAHAQLLASIQQDLKGGVIKIGGTIFDSKEVCIAFACCDHLTQELTY